MPSVIDVEGIGPKYAEKLKKAGIATTDTLLKKGAAPKVREAIVKATGISHDLILHWVNFVDLYRIKGVGSEKDMQRAMQKMQAKMGKKVRLR